VILRRNEVDRFSRAAGTRVVDATLVTGRGYTQNRRMILRLADGRTVFAKQATDEITADWLRAEHRAYSQLRGSFVAELIGWDDDGGPSPLLVLQDLSGSRWPPPWQPGMVDSVLAMLAEVAAHPVLDGLTPVSDLSYMDGNWAEVAADPQPLLGLGMCSAGWLERALPVLLDAADLGLYGGAALMHLDVRSDNMCFPPGRTVLFDWNLAAVGNPEFDVAFWLPSLALEGGPQPDEVAAVSPGVAGLVAGFFASRAGLPLIPQAPLVRDIQRRQLAVALPWAARTLDLPPPLPVVP
jgi:hypothetical protein